MWSVLHVVWSSTWSGPPRRPVLHRAPSPPQLPRPLESAPSLGNGDQPVGVLLSIAAVRPIRLSWLAILCAVSVAMVSPSPPPAQAATGAAPRWSWPISAPHPVIRPFIAPESPYAAGHRGIDIESSPGAPVLAPTDGVVYFVGTVVNRPVLSIRHSDGLISSFEPVTSILAAGDAVRRGDTVGSIGASSVVAGSVAIGHCSSTCLHFGVRLYGEYISPLNYLGGIERSILLPTRRPP